MTSVPPNNPDHSQCGIYHNGAQGIVPAPEGCVQPEKHAVGAGSLIIIVTIITQVLFKSVSPQIFLIL